MDGRTRRIGALVAAAVTAVLGIGGGAASGAGTPGDTPRAYAVGIMGRTFVDDARRTAANGDAPASRHRTLDTTIFYPAAGTPSPAPANEPALDGAPPADGPFPLIVFAHGLAGLPGFYTGILKSWAAAGYVVAAPAFPLSRTTAPGGANAGDVTNQPGDMSFVITSVLELSKRGDTPLARLVDGRRVGVAGHSLGGITTLGVAAHTCCRDERVQAAIAMSGDPIDFPKGRFDFAHAPPLLLVHGTEDVAVDYDASVDVFNAARGPKGLVTIIDGDHGSPLALDGPALPSVVRATTAFFDAYLNGARGARSDIAAASESGITEIRFVAKSGARTTIGRAPRPARNLRATVTPRTNLTQGQLATVEWSGFTPGKTINVVQCSGRANGDVAACDFGSAFVLHANPTGAGSLQLPIVVGRVGNGVCDARHPCDIVVNDGGSLDADASVIVRISFAP